MPGSAVLLILVAIFKEAKSAVADNASLILYNNLSRSVNDSRYKCAESYCLPIEYDKLEVPFDDTGAVDVSVDLDVLQILEIDDIKFTVSFSMYFGVRCVEGPIVRK